MEVLSQFLTESVWLASLILLLVTFVESLAIIGLLIPSGVIMTAVGILIAQSYFNFYLAWSMAFLGCFLGDALSFILGRRFKESIMQWNWIKKQEKLIHKTEDSLVKNRFMSIILGRYIGLIRPIVPLLAGILNLKWNDYLIPSFLACISWPVLYLMPGIIAGAAAEFPKGVSPTSFQVLLGVSIILSWFVIWFMGKVKRFNQVQLASGIDNMSIHTNVHWSYPLLQKNNSRIVIISTSSVVICLLFFLFTHPLFIVYYNILANVFAI